MAISYAGGQIKSLSADEFTSRGKTMADVNQLVSQGLLTPSQGGQGEYTVSNPSALSSIFNTPSSAGAQVNPSGERLGTTLGGAQASLGFGGAPAAGTTSPTASPTGGQSFAPVAGVDVSGIFQATTGRQPTPDEFAQIQRSVQALGSTVQTNPAVTVSTIQTMARQFGGAVAPGGTGSVIGAGGGTGVGAGGGVGFQGAAPGSPLDTSAETLAASLGTTVDQLKNIIPGYGSVSSSENINELVSERQRAEQAIRDRFRPEYERVGREGEQALKATEGFALRAGGLGFSSVVQGNINSQIDVNNTQVRNLQRLENEALLNNNISYAQEIRKEREKREKNTLDLFRMAFDVQQEARQRSQFATQEARQQYEFGVTEARQQRSLDLEETNATLSRDINLLKVAVDIPEGQSITLPSSGMTVTGLKQPEPFFKSADLVRVMMDLPEGQTKTITDPATGQVHTLQGLQSPDEDFKYITEVNDQGVGTLITFNPSKPESTLKQVSLGKVGKTKTQAPSITFQQRAINAEAAGKVVSFLNSVKDEQGFVDTNDYQTARNAWVAEGNDAGDFDSNFASYTDPSDPSARQIFGLKGGDTQKYFERYDPKTGALIEKIPLGQ